MTDGLQKRGKELQTPSRRKKRRRTAGSYAFPLAIVAILLVGGALIAFSRTGRPTPTPVPTPEGVQVYEVASAEHVEGRVDYEQTPPVGGPHWGQWQNCGFYSEPVQTEAAVHALEHSAVWITYRPNLDDDQVETLRGMARQSHVLVSPWPRGLPSPVVASAWGVQLESTSASDPQLEQFVAAYRMSRNAPEPGAPCTGGIGDPE